MSKRLLEWQRAFSTKLAAFGWGIATKVFVYSPDLHRFISDLIEYRRALNWLKVTSTTYKRKVLVKQLEADADEQVRRIQEQHEEAKRRSYDVENPAAEASYIEEVRRLAALVSKEEATRAKKKEDISRVVKKMQRLEGEHGDTYRFFAQTFQYGYFFLIVAVWVVYEFLEVIHWWTDDVPASKNDLKQLERELRRAIAALEKDRADGAVANPAAPAKPSPWRMLENAASVRAAESPAPAAPARPLPQKN